jgi:D-hexose-6-phosphate mutarotase
LVTHQIDIMTLSELNQRYALSNQLHFHALSDDYIIAEIANQYAEARIALQGGHILTYQARGEAPLLWVSQDAKFAAGKSVRGGVPICWPWFGAHATESTFPAHGHARTTPWQVLRTEALPDGATRIALTICDTEKGHTLWPHPSSVEIVITVGKTLHIELTTQNTGSQPFTLGEALHTYFLISDVNNASVRGLDGCDYLDKVQGFSRYTQHGDIAIPAEVDRVYVDTEADCLILDRGLKRAIRISKQNSRSTVVWNPWIEKAEKMGDLGTDGYRKMLCVESGNAFDNLITVAPGDSHRLAVTYSTEPLNE